MKPEELTAALKTGDANPLYYFHGEEAYLMERAVRQAMDRLIAADFRDFNLNVYYGNESRGYEIVETAQTLPFFTDRRLIIVRRSEALPAAALEVLAGYIQDPSPSTTLIFIGEKIDQRKKFFADFKKKGELVEFKRLYENQLPAFIREEAAGKGKKIESAAIDLLVYLVGNNLQEIATQIEKTALYVGNREMVTLADVKEIVSDTKESTVFELANAVGEKDLAQSLRTLNSLVREGEALPLILAMLTRHFRQLWMVRELVDRNRPAPEIGKMTGINPYFLQGIISQARKFSVGELRQVFERLFETDNALKSGKDEIAVEQLIINLCNGKL